jgi:cell wall-associated NlpC family hydrolase
MVFKIGGYKLLRDAHQQATQGKPVEAEDRKPGDIAFFQNADGKIVHTGILLGADKIIHASGKVRIDHFDTEGILNQDTGTYTHRFTHLRRVLSA